MEEIYMWIEQYSGVSYDMSDIPELYDKYAPFVSPYDWKTAILMCLDRLPDAVDVINTYANYIPDRLPGKREMKSLVIQDATDKIVESVKRVTNALDLEFPKVQSLDDLANVVNVLSDLLDLLINTSLEVFTKNKVFEKYEEDNDDILEEIFEMSRSDISNMKFTVDAKREEYYDSLEEE